jgi:hypothetical protein
MGIVSSEKFTRHRSGGRVRLFARLAVAVSLAAGGVAVVGSPATANGCTAAGSYAGGSGTVGEPWQIATKEQLLRLSSRSEDWGAHFVQTGTDPIDLTGCTWTPIGRGFPQGQGSSDPFTGSYDGGNKTITGLTISLQAGDGYVGMFGYAVGATLSAISLVGADVTGHNKVGALVGEMQAGTVSNSSVTGNVSGNDWVGGLVGYNSGGSISNSHSSALVDGTETVGGLVGSNDGGTILRSFATGAVSGGEYAAGGLVGLHENAGLIEYSFATGSVTGGDEAYVGGLVGYVDTGNIANSYAMGSVTGGDGETYVGGLVGKLDVDTDGTSETVTAGFISNSYAMGSVSVGDGETYLGGLVGFAGDDLAITDSFWDSQTSGESESAGGNGAVGKTTAQMTDIETFEGSNWSISQGEAGSTTWGICSAANRGYPFLRWQTALGSGSPGFMSCSSTDNNTDNNNTDNGNSGGETVTVVDTAPSTAVPVTTVPVTTVPAPVVPVAVGGVLPQNPPGVVTVFENGQPVAVETFVEDDIELVLRASTFELRLGGQCAQACTIRATDDGRQVLELEANGSARVEGEGFLAGSTVDVWLFSEPKYLGQLTVGADGRFAGSLALGNIEVGEHTLQVNGLSPDGVQRSANLGVVVAPALTPTLPATGGDPAVLWALALAMFGVGLVLSVRRRALPPR